MRWLVKRWFAILWWATTGTLVWLLTLMIEGR